MDDSKPDSQQELVAEPDLTAEIVADTAQRAEIPIDRITSKGLQWFLFLACTLVIVLSFVLSTSDDIQVKLPNGKPLPEICTAKRVLNIGCPGCGMTRGFINISQGRLQRAWILNPASILMYGLVLSQIPYRLVQLVRLYQNRRPFSDQWAVWYFIVIAVVLITQWVVRLVAGVTV